VKFFNWTGTIWRGQLTFEPAMRSSSAFMIVFLFGGLTGVILASPPAGLRRQRLRLRRRALPLLLFGTVVFCMFGGFLLLVAEVHRQVPGQPARQNGTSGRFFIGFNMTFLQLHWAGVEGMPRRVANSPICRAMSPR